MANPSVLLLQPSIHSRSRFTVPDHRFLCFCHCGLEAWDVIWKDVNMPCDRPRWRTPAGGIGQKQTWIMIGGENKVFLFLATESDAIQKAVLWFYCSAESQYISHPEGINTVERLHTWKEQKPWSYKYVYLGTIKAFHILEDLIFQFSFSSCRSPTSSFSFLAKGWGPGQEFWKGL